MKIARTVAEVRDFRMKESQSDRSLGLIPTMGALHAGHLSLVKAARLENERVAVSIFVNPTQFGPNEDLDKYPRTFDSDCALLLESGVDLVFAPETGVMYPFGFSTTIDIGAVGSRLDGASRPGHFQGVATVVAKLFNIFTPTRAYFGQKDAAQIAVIRKLVKDMEFPIELIACPTIREEDGLALSSRNRFLNAQQRREAIVLSRSLSVVERLVGEGELDSAVLLAAARAVLSKEPAFRLDYLVLVNPDTLEDLPERIYSSDEATLPSCPKDSLLAVAGWLGDTRLIDNVVLRTEASLLNSPVLNNSNQLKLRHA